MVRPEYVDNPIASILVSDGKNTILQPQNINYSFNWQFYLYGTWKPLNWIEISPYLEYYTYKYNTPSSRIYSTYFRYGAIIAFAYDKFDFSLHANSPTKEYDGNLCKHGSAQFGADLLYKYRKWSFGASYNFSGHNNRTTGYNKDFSYNVTEDNKPLHTLFRINVTYSFSIGKSRSHGRKYLNESSNEDGLNKYNKPEAPK